MGKGKGKGRGKYNNKRAWTQMYIVRAGQVAGNRGAGLMERKGYAGKGMRYAGAGTGGVWMCV